MTEPIRATADRLLSADVRKEFLIASVETENHRRVRFRLNPAHAFERVGCIARYPSGELRVTVSQQYRPHDEMTWLIGVWELTSRPNSGSSPRTPPGGNPVRTGARRTTCKCHGGPARCR